MQIVTFLKQQSRNASPLPTEPTREAKEGDRIDLSGLPTRGSSDSSLVLVEFSDFECPFCIRHQKTVAGEIDQEYVQKGKLRVAFVNNPLPIHQNAIFLATASVCAGKQDRYWPAHDWLFEAQPKTTDGLLMGADALLLNREQLFQCMENGDKILERIKAEIELARGLGLNGTPEFALGIMENKNTVRVKKYINGAQPITVFREAISDLIRKGKV